MRAGRGDCYPTAHAVHLSASSPASSLSRRLFGAWTSVWHYVGVRGRCPGFVKFRRGGKHAKCGDRKIIGSNGHGHFETPTPFSHSHLIVACCPIGSRYRRGTNHAIRCWDMGESRRATILARAAAARCGRTGALYGAPRRRRQRRCRIDQATVPCSSSTSW